MNVATQHSPKAANKLFATFKNVRGKSVRGSKFHFGLGAIYNSAPHSGTPGRAN